MVQGWQGTLSFDASALEFKDAVFGAFQPTQVGLRHTADGAITLSWNDPEGQIGKMPDQLITLIFKAKQNALLSQILRIGSRFTRAEAYNAQGELLNVGLQFIGGRQNPSPCSKTCPTHLVKQRRSDSICHKLKAT
ncbi:MAG: hypothetical protein IPN33_16095 [Saprospiraceae bacterium]|nr:hypothetical protein [Saprospiraceae bacterium]